MENINLKVAGAVILILLSINGYWLANLVGTVETLKDVVTELKVVVRLQNENAQYQNQRINECVFDIEMLEKDFGIHKATQNAHPKN